MDAFVLKILTLNKQTDTAEADERWGMEGGHDEAEERRRVG